MRLIALRTASIAAAIVFAPVTAAFAAQSGSAVPKLPASSWKPDKPVEFVVQSAAGGGSDIFARTMAKVLADEKIVTVPINVVNKPGGSGAVAYSYLNQKKGNPYIIATATGSYITTPIQGHSPVSYKNFTNLAVLCVEDYVGVVRAESPYKSLKELIAAAKQKPNSHPRRRQRSRPVPTPSSRHRLEKAAGVKLNLHRVPERRRGERGAARRQRRLRQPESQRGHAAGQGEPAAADRHVLAAAARQLEGCADRQGAGDRRHPRPVPRRGCCRAG